MHYRRLRNKDWKNRENDRKEAKQLKREILVSRRSISTNQLGANKFSHIYVFFL
jgi:hypothetical protein